MGRLMAIDYGRRRCGIAVTDPMRIVANGLTTVATSDLIEFIKQYTTSEQVDRIIVGLPTTTAGTPSESMNYITPGIARLRKALPDLPVEFFDERFTSVIAHRSMIDMGMKKMQRRDKAAVDTIAAAIILNDYIQSNQYKQTL
ncbi:MAG: Holliday junction resolvase RuvX [Bacteroides sp.]|nr:Holliday junction resolvase RuvX [Bacteroides sp.]MCM1414127.1 Holliday junction resolvase RuvX [Bacteroides sp.]MCM1470993.1 Holliday junction resolvase RuvX [Bacteroides sp.]